MISVVIDAGSDDDAPQQESSESESLQGLRAAGDAAACQEDSNGAGNDRDQRGEEPELQQREARQCGRTEANDEETEASESRSGETEQAGESCRS